MTTRSRRPRPIPVAEIPKPDYAVHNDIKSLAETILTPCPASDPLVENFLDRGQTAMLSGRHGLGKTPFLAQLAITIASDCGGHFLGMPVRPGKVAIVDMETPADRHRKMLQTICGGLELDKSHVFPNLDVFVRGNPNDPNSRELDRVMQLESKVRWQWLASLAAKQAYNLIVLDTLVSMFPMSTSNEQDTREAFGAIGAIQACKPYPAFHFSHHLRKPDSHAPPPALHVDPIGWLSQLHHVVREVIEVTGIKVPTTGNVGEPAPQASRRYAHLGGNPLQRHTEIIQALDLSA